MLFATKEKAPYQFDVFFGSINIFLKKIPILFQYLTMHKVQMHAGAISKLCMVMRMLNKKMHLKNDVC